MFTSNDEITGKDGAAITLNIPMNLNKINFLFEVVTE